VLVVVKLVGVCGSAVNNLTGFWKKDRSFKLLSIVFSILAAMGRVGQCERGL
jgi:hypothetical protein